MMSKRKTIIWSVVAALVIIQFIRPGRNTSGQASENSMISLFHPPDSIVQILNQSCMNCHSNNTDYPWYASVEPLGWWLDRHIRKGKDELNLDEFAGYSDRRKRSKLRYMKSQVADGEMPLRSYILLNRASRLFDTQKNGRQACRG